MGARQVGEKARRPGPAVAPVLRQVAVHRERRRDRNRHQHSAGDAVGQIVVVLDPLQVVGPRSFRFAAPATRRHPRSGGGIASASCAAKQLRLQRGAPRRPPPCVDGSSWPDGVLRLDESGKAARASPDARPCARPHGSPDDALFYGRQLRNGERRPRMQCSRAALSCVYASRWPGSRERRQHENDKQGSPHKGVGGESRATSV